jgi:hypothetical protein
MIHIYVDYQGRTEKTYSFTSAGPEYQAKLDELETYGGKIDGIQIYIGSDKVSGAWDEHPSRLLVKTTNVGIAVRKGRIVKYP